MGKERKTVRNGEEIPKGFPLETDELTYAKSTFPQKETMHGKSKIEMGFG